MQIKRSIQIRFMATNIGSSLQDQRNLIMVKIKSDGTSSNDLLYVPTNAEIDAMNFAPLTDINGNVQNAAIQRQTFKNFIAQDDYLSKNQGKYTEKYAGESPWFSQLDLRILQDLNFKAGKQKNTLQLSIDIMNF